LLWTRGTALAAALATAATAAAQPTVLARDVAFEGHEDFTAVRETDIAVGYDYVVSVFLATVPPNGQVLTRVAQFG
jgi:hypothetical protein